MDTITAQNVNNATTDTSNVDPNLPKDHQIVGLTIPLDPEKEELTVSALQSQIDQKNLQIANFQAANEQIIKNYTNELAVLQAKLDKVKAALGI